MAKLYYRYGAMNCGKTTALLQAAHNYEEHGMQVLILKPKIDSKGEDTIVSRLGVERKVDLLVNEDDKIHELIAAKASQPIHCILIDEAQFLTPAQAEELFWFATEKAIPVLAYGLRTDFQTRGFPGSTRLLELAHEIQELKTICRCGKKAVLNGRKVNGSFIFEGSQVAIEGEGNVEYESLCARCFQKLVKPVSD